jgi:branched-chain amino acid transport system permease protein
VGQLIFKRPFFWLIVAATAVFVLLPLRGNNVDLRETLLLGAVSIILASNVNLMIGYTGYVNFGNIVFYGLGGYLGIYLSTSLGWPLVLAALAAGAVVSLFALVFGAAILRLRGAYFALATIGVNEAVKAFVANFRPWGKAEGIYLAFTAYQPLGGPMHALWVIYFLVIGVMAASLLVSYAVKRSKFGLGLFAIREDEDAAIVLGVRASRYKTIVFSLSAFLPAMAGALVFFKNGMIDPGQAFDLTLSIEAIVMMMLGGQGTVTGAALGAFLYEELRGYLLTQPSLSNFHLVIAGALLLVIVLFAPGGLMGAAYQRLPVLRRVLE